tara:strand:+ start:493 stop:858 length:366 start_codon:yes stop_codon:yes gene_type:complete
MSKIIERLSINALEQLFGGAVTKPATCVVKFYSNDCYLCVGLKQPFHKLAELHDDVLFFAFNIKDHDNLDDVVELNGVPSICLLNLGETLEIHNLEDPSEPDENHYFTIPYMNNFIRSFKK